MVCGFVYWILLLLLNDLDPRIGCFFLCPLVRVSYVKKMKMPVLEEGENLLKKGRGESQETLHFPF